MFYGSNKSGTTVDHFSYYDFYVVLKDGTEEEFYKNLIRYRHAKNSRFVRWLKARFAYFLHPHLTPAIYDFTEKDKDGRLVSGAKFCFISRSKLERELSLFPSDYHQLARFSQPMRLVFPRTEETAREAAAILARAHRCAFDFIAPRLPFVFDVTEFVNTFLQASYATEVRPESQLKIKRIIENERHHLYPVYAEVLHERVQAGDLVQINTRDGRFALKEMRTNPIELMWRWFSLKKSKLRDIARWFKNMMTFDSWTAYIDEKVERNIGFRLGLKPYEGTFMLFFGPYHLTRYFLAKSRHTRKMAVELARQEAKSKSPQDPHLTIH
jgi:hypothetical protein